MHKHFRIIGIAELMKNHGVSGTHTGITGIWAKLRTLYNLDGLDEREDAPDADVDDDEEDEKPGGVSWDEFSLPEEVFGELMRARRIDPESRDSPARLWKEKGKKTEDEDGEDEDDGMSLEMSPSPCPADLHRFVARGIACGGCGGGFCGQGWRKIAWAGSCEGAGAGERSSRQGW